MDKICGIYCIQNLINGKKYVGLSHDCAKRWSDHYSKSAHSTQKEDLDKPLYRAMRKYGRENFAFSILEECAPEQLKEKEIFWIEKLNTYHQGYNATAGGDLGGRPLQGEEHGRHKLTLEQVIMCRNLYRDGASSREVWEQYFTDIITYSGFQRMWHGKTWKTVMPEVFKSNPNPKQKITMEIIKEMKALFAQGKTCAEVYHYYHEFYSRTTINDIYHGRRYSNII